MICRYRDSPERNVALLHRLTILSCSRANPQSQLVAGWSVVSGGCDGRLLCGARIVNVRPPRRTVAGFGLVPPRRPPLADAAGEQLQERPRRAGLDQRVE